MKDEQTLIAEFNKNSIEKVKVHVQTRQGQEYINIRIWHLPNPGEDGAEGPTKKGITLRLELFPDLQRAIEDVAEYLKKRAEMTQERRSQEGIGNLPLYRFLSPGRSVFKRSDDHGRE